MSLMANSAAVWIIGFQKKRALLERKKFLFLKNPDNSLYYLLELLQENGNAEILFIFLFGVLHCFQHCAGHITTGSWKSRGNQYIQLVNVLYCKLPTNSKQLPAFPPEVEGYGTPTSELGDDSVTTLPPWPPGNAEKQVTEQLLLLLIKEMAVILYVIKLNH